jgi:DnaK suppressor protein
MSQKTDEMKLDSSYVPSFSEPFMNPKQLEYFKIKLMNWRDQILKECSETITDMQDNQIEADVIDAAAKEVDHTITLRARDRERKLLKKIDEALRRIESGSYGYCEETGEPIGLKRLDARPIATLSIEAQERHEREERTHRDG